MEKKFDFIKKQPYLTINIIGLLLIISCFFVKMVSGLGSVFAIYILAAFFNFWFAWCILFAINIFSFVAVENDKSVLGILFSLLLGSLGGFIACNKNKNYVKSEVIKIIFNIHIWFIVWMIASLLASGFNFKALF